MRRSWVLLNNLRRASLEASKVLDDTLVIVTMDHGQIAKDAVYEGGIRTVLMMRLPGVFDAGSIVATPVTNLDIVATILEFKGLLSTVSFELDGISLLAAATKANSDGTGSAGTDLQQRQCIIAEIEQLRAVLCGGRYKYISKLSADDGIEAAYPASNAVEQTYDLASDPTEQTNLADAAAYPGYAAITAAMREFVACHDADSSPAGSTSCVTAVLKPLDVVNDDDNAPAPTPAPTTAPTTTLAPTTPPAPTTTTRPTPPATVTVTEVPAACEDDVAWSRNNRNCGWVAQKTRHRCRLFGWGPTGSKSRASDACPAACGAC